MAAYHVPFVPRHRYWTGMLLLVRAVLYFIAAAKVSDSPQVRLVAIVIMVTLIVFFKMVFATRVFNNRLLDALDSFFYANTILFAACTSYTLSSGRNQDGISYTSVSLSIIVTFIIAMYHICKYTSLWSHVSKSKLFTNSSRNFKSVFVKQAEDVSSKETEDIFYREVECQQKPTSSVIEIN